MPTQRKDFQIFGGVDRLKGERFLVQGAGLVVTSDNPIPAVVELAFDSQDAPRIPLGQLRRRVVDGGFREVWIFHPNIPGQIINVALVAFGPNEQVPDVADLPVTATQSQAFGNGLTMPLTPIGTRELGTGTIQAATSRINVADGESNNFAPWIHTIAQMFGWNGATHDMIRTAGAAVLATLSSFGAMLVDAPGDWAVFNFGGAGVLANATRPAGGAGVRHVVTSLSATIITGATAMAVPVRCILNDGAGAIWAIQVMLPANSQWTLQLSNLHIVCAPNQSIGLLFTAAPPADGYQSAAITGHDTN